MGLVYAARHRSLQRTVAIKTLRAEIAQDAELVARFQQEARAAGALGHPNIVQVFDAGTTSDGLHYMVMEKLEGQSLHDVMGQEPLIDPVRAAAIMAQVLSALSAAHRRGIVHRDLKPENIFLARTDTGAQVKLLDFGISKILEQAEQGIAGADIRTRATRLGVVMGTPLYMSPEQARGEGNIDHRTDLWSAACVLYEMLCGKTPFEGENYNQVMAAILEDAFDPPSKIRPAVSPELERVILRGKARQRSERYTDAEAMRAALMAAVGSGTATQPASEASPVPRRPQGPGAGSGLGSALDAAAHHSSVDDAKFLSAFDSLRTIGEEPPAAEPPARAPTPPPAPSRAAALAPSRSAAPRGAQHDPFAPPPETAAEAALDVDQAILHKVAPGRVSARPSMQHGTVAPRARSGGASGVIKLLVALAVVAGGAGVGYRYWRLGYLLSPPPARPATLAFSVSPAEAEVAVNSERIAQSVYEVEGGRPYRVRFRAPGRLAVERDVTPKAGESIAIDVRLPLGGAAIDPTMAHAVPDEDRPHSPPGSFEVVDEALSKVELYARCLAVLGRSLLDSHEAYAKSTQGKIGPDSMPILLPLDADAALECRGLTETARARNPGLAELDAAGAQYIAAVGALAPVVRDLSAYYHGPDAKQDRLERGKKAHPKLVKLFAAATTAQARLGAAVLREQRIWQAGELAMIARRDGKQALWHMRRVFLASQEWALAEAAGADRKLRETRRAELDEARAAAGHYADGDRDGMAALRGAAEYLASVKAVAEASGADALTWHNNSVKLFNAMTLSQPSD